MATQPAWEPAGAEPAPPAEPTTPGEEAEAAERSLADDVRDLVDEGVAYVKAEAEFQKTRAAHAAQGARGIAALGAVAGVLAFFAMVALTVGLVIALTPHLTAWGATALVVAVYLVLAAILASTAAARWRRLTAELSGGAPGR